jgi:hypothetical protein
MTPFRGSDEDLEREIATVQGMVRVRLRRANGDLRELDDALRDLRRELRRRRGSVAVAAEAEVAETGSA